METSGTPRVPPKSVYGSEGWGFESLRTRQISAAQRPFPNRRGPFVFPRVADRVAKPCGLGTQRTWHPADSADLTTLRFALGRRPETCSN